MSPARGPGRPTSAPPAWPEALHAHSLPSAGVPGPPTPQACAGPAPAWTGCRDLQRTRGASPAAGDQCPPPALLLSRGVRSIGPQGRQHKQGGQTGLGRTRSRSDEDGDQERCGSGSGRVVLEGLRTPPGQLTGGSSRTGNKISSRALGRTRDRRGSGWKVLGQLCPKAGFTTSASSQGSSRVPCTGTSRGPASGGILGVRLGRRGQGGSRRRGRGNSSGPSLGTPSHSGPVGLGRSSLPGGPLSTGDLKAGSIPSPWSESAGPGVPRP